MPYAMQDEHFPLVFSEMRGWVSEADWGRFFADYDRLLARQDPFASVFDSTGMRVPELHQFHNLVHFMRERTEPIRRLHLGCACVMITPLLRGLLAALGRLGGLPMKVVVMSDRESAIRWANERLARHSVPRAQSAN